MGDAVNKIASIFAEATADAVFDETQISESEKVDKAIKTVKSVLDKAYAGALAKMTTKPLHDVLISYSREEAIALLDKYIRKYEKFINATSQITGRTVIYMQNPYGDKSDSYIQNDIKFTILVVYLSAITEESVKIAVSRTLQEIFGLIKEVRIENRRSIAWQQN